MRRLALLALLAGCGPKEARVIDGPQTCDQGCTSPDDRSREGVCARWREGHAISTPIGFSPGLGACEPGSLADGAIADTIRRIDLFRWLAGLDGVGHDPAFDADAQACSVLAAHWDFGRQESPHTPSPDATCYSEAGRRAASTSNLSWGVRHPANTIDGFMEDAGANNVDALGHRRWILNPPLGLVGVGYYEGGTNLGVASCLRVFDMSGGGAAPAWNAVPPAGFAPIEMARWTWSLQGSVPGVSAAAVTMTDDAGAPLAIEVHRLQVGAGEPAVAWIPVGWAPAPDTTYHVTVSGLVGGDVSYEVTPVVCD